MSMSCRVGFIALTLLLIAMTPIAAADLSVENHTLSLVCSNDDCSLSKNEVGDVMLSEEERQATLLQPVTITLEFPMRPAQTSVSLLPSTVESMTFDFRIQEDGTGATVSSV